MSLHHFLLGTCALHSPNELHQVEFNEETGDIRCARVYEHPEEVWHIAPCPTDPTLVTTVHAARGRKRATLWRFPNAGGEALSSSDVSSVGGPDDLTPRPLERVAEVGGDSTASSSSDKGTDNAAASVHFAWEASTTQTLRGLHTLGNRIQVVTLADGALDVSSTLHARDVTAPTGRTNSSRHPFSKAVFDPHHVHEFAAVAGGDIFGHDLRLSKTAHAICGAHTDVVMDLDYNPNKPYCLVSCGDDCMVRFWDLRMASKAVSVTDTSGGRAVQAPLRVLRGHSHWVHAIKYNPFHDQLLLSAGSDASVGLWRVSSISSAPLLEMDPDEGGDGEEEGSDSDGTGSRNSEDEESRDRAHSSRSLQGTRDDVGEAGDMLIRKSDEHEESVYSIAWSASEAWTYASLSLDGRMVVSHVPSAEKYKILL